MNIDNRMQEVIQLLESNLFDMNYELVAKTTGIPNGLFNRIFSYICGISMSDYVRKRKLTKSAEIILHGKRPITYLALDCGYESTASFTRAFKELFTVPPTKINQKLYEELAFRPISFSGADKNYITKGRKMMAELVKIQYEVQEDLLFIGVSNKVYGVSGRQLWDIYFGEHFDEKLVELNEFQVQMEDNIGLGYATEFTSETELGESYMVGRLFELNTKVPEGMTGVIIKGGTQANAQIKGACFEDILNNAYILISEMVEKNGYQLDYENFYWIELYTLDRFCIPIEKGEDYIICDWIVPCKKA